jgi:hypothetical protein|tara:strand:- start:1162 stop:1539 length:378 start_codon:yes stop_codon:yes gene_type:complete
MITIDKERTQIIIKHLASKSILLFNEKYSEKQLSWNQFQKKHKKDSEFNYRGVKFLQERPFLKKPFIVSPNKLVYGLESVCSDRFCLLFDYNDIPESIKVLVDENICKASLKESKKVYNETYVTA